MKDNKSEKWSVGLKFVQFQKNSSHHSIIGRSPYKTFDCESEVGLITSNLAQEVLKQWTVEEDLEEINNQYEEEIQKQINVERHCEICKVESTEDFCNLCQTNQKIEEKCQATHTGQKKDADKMLQVPIIYYI
jgi:hypothetical protein